MVAAPGGDELLLEDPWQDQQRKRLKPGDRRRLVGGLSDGRHQRRGRVALECRREQPIAKMVEGRRQGAWREERSRDGRGPDPGSGAGPGWGRGATGNVANPGTGAVSRQRPAGSWWVACHRRMGWVGSTGRPSGTRGQPGTAPASVQQSPNRGRVNGRGEPAPTGISMRRPRPPRATHGLPELDSRARSRSVGCRR